MTAQTHKDLRSFCEQMAEIAEKEELNKLTENGSFQLPLLKSYLLRDMGVLPSDIARSALFTITNAKNRNKTEIKSIPSYKDYSISYEGYELTQIDLDVWITAIYLAHEQNTRTIKMTQSSFLKAMGRVKSGSNAKVVRNSIRRLMTGIVSYKKGSKWYEGTLISEAGGDTEGDKDFYITINPNIVNLFLGNNTYINKEVRKALNGNLSKWLYNYISSHKATIDKPSCISITRLMDLSGTKSNRADFNFKLKKSLNNLQEEGVLEQWEIVRGILAFVRKKKLNK